jgi:hypothetical protein
MSFYVRVEIAVSFLDDIGNFSALRR